MPADPHVRDHHNAPRSRSGLTTAVVLLCGFAVFAAAGVAGGLLLRQHPSSGLSAPLDPVARRAPLAPGASAVPSAPTGRLDESTGLASIGPATMTLPGAPYELDDDPMEIDGVFDTLFSADARVHPDYDGKHSWSATVMLAHLSPALTGSSNLDQVGASAMLALSEHLFGGHATEMRHLASADRSVDGHPGLRFTADIHYSVTGLPSRYDTVTGVLVRLDDGSLVAAVSSVPDDAEPDVTRLAAESIESLSVR